MIIRKRSKAKILWSEGNRMQMYRDQTQSKAKIWLSENDRKKRRWGLGSGHRQRYGYQKAIKHETYDDQKVTKGNDPVIRKR
jgi:hypothetical protein